MDRYEVGYTFEDGNSTLECATSTFAQAFTEGQQLVKKGLPNVEIYDRMARIGKPQRWKVTENTALVQARKQPPTDADPGDALDLLPACKHPPTALTCWHADSPTGPVLCVACNCGAVLAGGAE